MAMIESILALANTIEESAVGVSIAESRYAFAVIEGIHLVGLAFAAGLIFVTDLRLMNLFLKKVPVAQVVHHLRPWVIGGFVAIFISGGLLFWSEAARLMDSPAFPIKMLLVVLAGLNALYFEFVIAKRPAVRHCVGDPPRSAKLAGLASFTLWSLVIVFGRLIPYLPSWSLS